jgi:hypothetical protein
MSLQSDVGVRPDLPLPEVRRAAQEVDAASRRLAAVLSKNPAGVRPLNAALAHLDTAAGALLLAQHSIQGYLASVPAELDPLPSTVDPPILPTWWAERVAELTGHRSVPADPFAGTSDALLRAAVTRALDADRAGLAEVLSAADPATGLGLARLTAPLVQRYADLADDPYAALATVRYLLPRLPDEVAEAQLAGTPPRPWERHPADPAIAGTVLVAALLNLLGLAGLPEVS